MTIYLIESMVQDLSVLRALANFPFVMIVFKIIVNKLHTILAYIWVGVAKMVVKEQKG